jgi:ADP-heptose:LPS heptosyltransferase
VLLVRLDNAGDVLLMGPAARAVAAGAARVTVLAGPAGAAAARLLPGVDDVIVHRAPWIDPEPRPLDPGQTLGLVAQLAGVGADQAIVFTSFHQSPLPAALLLRLAEVPVVAAISEDYPGSLLDVRHRVDEEIHEVERALSLAATLGYRLPAGDDGRLRVRRPALGRVAVPESPYVVVHPGASVPARAWAPDRHAELVEALAARAVGVVVTGSGAEAELTEHVARDVPGAVDLGGRTDLAGLAEVIAGAACLVAGNTGPAHLAAAVGTPVVSLFAPTVPATRWRPWGVPHVLLGDQDIACRGCRARACPVPGHPCLGSVGVDDVLRAVDELARLPERAHAEAVA